jgi:hypothetical protein
LKYYKKKVVEYYENRCRIELVIARYKENLEWLCDPDIQTYLKDSGCQINIRIYNKGDNCEKILEHLKQKCDPAFIITCESLPNVGCEGHTYLHHIIHHYNHLADVTIFLQGSSHLPNKFMRVQKTIEQACLHKNSFFFITRATLPDSFNNFVLEKYQFSSNTNKGDTASITLEPAKFRPFENWYHKMFPEVGQIETGVVWNSIFAIEKSQVHKKPIEHYRKFIEQLNHHVQPEALHYIERSWLAIFYPIPKENIEY